MPSKKSHTGAALITGGAKRIGQHMALYLSGLGYKIALHYNHSKAEAEKTAAQIKEAGGSCEIFQCDLADEKETTALIPAVLKKFPDLNLLINSASIFEKSNIREGNVETFNRHFAINLKAPYILISAFAQECKKGHIVNILDTHIAGNKTAHSAYLLSKKSLSKLTQLAAVELAPDIRLNGIAPGLILPPAGQEENYLERLAKNIPLKKKGALSDVVQALEFLLKSDFVTGQIIFVDGGEHLVQ